MEIKPIKTEADYEATLSEIEKLWDSGPDTPESDRLDILVTLVEAYETKHYPIDPPDPVDAIKFRMEQMGLTDKDLGKYMGGRGRVTKILNRQLPLSLDMIRKLHKNLGIPAEVLISEPSISEGTITPRV
ncbi:MAG: helix-turn-helix domain-containing protein [Desulfomonilaceae bacterium]|jgi:HTH-type transcriptional regulator/antitoxin HigA